MKDRQARRLVLCVILFMIIMLTIAMFNRCSAQQIGDYYTSLPDHRELGVEQYRVFKYHHEVICYKDSVLTVYIFDISNDIMLGIDYICPTADRLNKAVLDKIWKDDNIHLGGNIFTDTKNLIILMEEDERISIRNMEYSRQLAERIFKSKE